MLVYYGCHYLYIFILLAYIWKMVIDMRDDRIAFLINSLSDGGAEKVVKLLSETLYNDNII